MPLLGTLLVNLVTFLASIFGRFFVAEKAFRLAAVVTLLGLVTALYTSMMSCATGVCATAISGMSLSHKNFAVGLAMVFNSTTYSAVSCYVTVWTVCQIYVIKKRMTSLVFK